MSHELNVLKRQSSSYYFIDVTLPNGKKLHQRVGGRNRKELDDFLTKLIISSTRKSHLNLKPAPTWQEAVVRYLKLKTDLKSYKDVQRICRGLNPYLDNLKLNQITGEEVWHISQSELKRGNKPATVNRYLAVMRNVLRIARDEWQWIETIPKIKLLSGEVERERWLTRDQANRLIGYCPPHLAAMVQFALATGLRASEITGLEWSRVDLNRRTAWLNHTKNGVARGVPLNRNAVTVLQEQFGKHASSCFTYRGKPIASGITNSAWYTALKKSGITDFRFHDLRHTWASWHRQSGTSCDELKDLGGWKSRLMVDRYAKFATDHLQLAASRIEGR